MSIQQQPKLFDEFSPVATEEWEKKIREDLKGADYESKLVWLSPEGIKVQPYYRKEHLADKEYLETLPCEYPYVRGNKTNSNNWEIRQDIPLDDIMAANKNSLSAINNAVTSLGFFNSSLKEELPVKSSEDFGRLLHNIPVDRISLNFSCGYNAPQLVNMLYSEIEARNMNPENIHGSTDFDPLGFLTITGTFCKSEDNDLETLSMLLKFVSKKLPNYRVLSVNGYFFHNAGSSVVQELGYSLALAADYISYLTEKGFSVDVISRHLQFNLGIGANYFMEIAKIRAFRLLWAKTVEAFNPAKKESMKAFIHSVTSERNQTIYDPYMNVLRATTESMAAIIGGTDSLVVRPFTFPYKKATPFSDRLARNTQIILNEEAYFGKVIDPSAGSYYIESLTDAIIDEAWNIFLKVESEGGYLKALKKGIIQKDIEATARHRDQLINTRRESLTGINQYPNLAESIINEVDSDIAFPRTNAGSSVIAPLNKTRGSMEFEKLRLATENHGYRPKVFMLTFGDLSMRRARATFSCNFFACAGYEVIDNPGFSTIERGKNAALKAKADIVVLCSSDEDYLSLTMKVIQSLKEKTLLVVAGAAGCMDELRTKGVEKFIHARSNMLETLKFYHKTLGITL